MITESFIRDHVVSVKTPKSFSDFLILADKLKNFERVFTTDGLYRIEKFNITYLGNFGKRGGKSFSIELARFGNSSSSPLFDKYKELSIQDAVKNRKELVSSGLVSWVFTEEKASTNFSPFFLLKCPRLTDSLEDLYENEKKLNPASFFSFIATYYNKLKCYEASSGKEMSSILQGLINTHDVGSAAVYKRAWVDKLSPTSRLHPNHFMVVVGPYLYVVV